MTRVQRSRWRPEPWTTRLSVVVVTVLNVFIALPACLLTLVALAFGAAHDPIWLIVATWVLVSGATSFAVVSLVYKTPRSVRWRNIALGLDAGLVVLIATVYASGATPDPLSMMLAMLIGLINSICVLLSGHHHVPGLCPRCGYELRLLHQTGCPECGWRRD